MELPHEHRTYKHQTSYLAYEELPWPLNFLLNLCNFLEDDGVILILQSHRLGEKKSIQPMNFFCLTILGMSSSCSNRNMIPKELVFLDEGILIIFMLLLSWVEDWIHTNLFSRRSGPPVGHGYLPGGPFSPWPRLTNSRSRASTMS